MVGDAKLKFRTDTARSLYIATFIGSCRFTERESVHNRDDGDLFA